ncbi:glycosyl transferase family 2 [Aminobacter aminovorans]|jgi:glycosyltransferase involved in cell wall biosynthesis|uniref:Chondroitin polymerase n=1 Tax=Aminobacter aminovorans TaxID=83263 RepID=A0A380WHH8_AMIAI|nr:glycosyltransferase family A protein [Aminobacter aminovorans]TCS28589.1 glycosyl transferase family 2 [Aminobacter aminovorans]SUU88443.1 Chondroitin polymerase [Aminobacter aminovorans]
MSYSVVIPAWNAARTIAETLRSVAAQSVPPAEIIVVDDGSSDETEAAVLQSGVAVRYVRQNNAGPGSATTRGFALATAPFIATVDADDLWLRQKVERQLRRLDEAPQLTAVFTLWRTFRHGQPDDGTGTAGPGWSRTTMLVRREVALAVGPVIDPPGNRGEMVDWLGRARENGHQLGMIDEVLALRRILPGSMSYGRDPARDRGYLEVARMAMLRRKLKNTGQG